MSKKMEDARIHADVIQALLDNARRINESLVEMIKLMKADLDSADMEIEQMRQELVDAKINQD